MFLLFDLGHGIPVRISLLVLLRVGLSAGLGDHDGPTVFAQQPLSEQAIPRVIRDNRGSCMFSLVGAKPACRGGDREINAPRLDAP